MSADKLNFANVLRIDTAREIDDVLSLPDHLRDARFRAESARVGEIDAPAGLLVCGMGGSAIGGDLAAAVCGDHLMRPLHVIRAYALPPWATEGHAVLCSSYSGNTEETLATFEAAGAVGAHRIVATTGGELAERARAESVPVIGLPAGLQPRAAVAYGLVCVLEVAGWTGVSSGVRMDIDASAGSVDSLIEEWGPDAPPDSLAKAVALVAQAAQLCVYGADLTTPVAYRWRTQMSENAKLLSSCGELPEIDHNEIVGWGGARSVGRYAAVFLEDSDQHPRTAQRFRLTEELIKPSAVSTFRISSRGTTRLARLLSLVLLGDLVSIYTAVLRGVDPTPVEVIDRLKSELGRIS